MNCKPCAARVACLQDTGSYVSGESFPLVPSPKKSWFWVRGQMETKQNWLVSHLKKENGTMSKVRQRAAVSSCWDIIVDIKFGHLGSDLEHIQLGGRPAADPDQERWGGLYFSSVPGRTLCSLGGDDGGRTEDVQGFSAKIANLSTCTCTVMIYCICSILTLQKLEENTVM